MLLHEENNFKTEMQYGHQKSGRSVSYKCTTLHLLHDGTCDLKFQDVIAECLSFV